MRLFERVVFRCELSNVINNSIGSDQFAYRKGLNTTMPWLSASRNGLDGLIVMLTLFVFSHLILVKHLILYRMT